MSNLIAFNSVFERAMRVEEHRQSFDEALRIQVPTQVIVFAKSHIDLLEEQLAKLQHEAVELRAIAAAVEVKSITTTAAFKYNWNGDAVIKAGVK